MRTYLVLILVTLTMIVSITSIGAQSQNESPYIYKIIAAECKHTPNGRILTGFRVKGVHGIVTALHGVADCKVIRAESSAPNTRSLENLHRAAADIDHDVVLLRSAGTT